MLAELKNKARAIKRDIVALWIAARDPRVPWPAQLMAALVTAYALSPIDFIPDFIPVIGFLDDIILVPLGIWIVVRMIPPALMAECREKAAQMEGKPQSRMGAALIIMLWLGVLMWAWSYATK
jgi:uncharacterized membrane protein YkvA (DUF1232 family)